MSRSPARGRGCALVLLAFAAVPAPAVDRLEISAGAITAPEWSTGPVSATLHLGPSDEAMALAAHAREVRLPGDQEFPRVALECTELALAEGTVACREGRAEIPLEQLDAPGFRITVTYRPADGHMDGSITGVQATGGTLEAEVHGTPANWRLEAAGAQLRLPAAASVLAPWLPELPPGLSYDGRGDLAITAEGGTTVQRATVHLELGGVTFTDASGLRAGEGVAATLEAEASRQGAGWGLEAGLELSAGAVYVDPWYVEAGERPLSARCSGSTDGDGRIRLKACRIDHPGVVTATGALQISPGAPQPVGDGRIEFTLPDLAAAYGVYLQPLLAGTPGDRLQVTGRAEGELALAAGTPESAELRASGISAEDEGGRFGMHGLDGALHWRRDGGAPVSQLTWEGGYLWRLDFGPSRLAVRAGGATLTLTEPLMVPLLDGELVVEAFNVDSVDDAVSGLLEGYLTPISMERLSSTFGWPVFRGQVSGVLPAIRLRDRRVTIDGALLMNIFDGRVVLRDLVVDRPLGLVPEMRANLDIDNIDLDLLTSAFSFGRIQGRLDGRIRDLVLQDWQPVAFEARLDTPQDGDFRKRISQQAVDDLTRVGGGAGIGGALFLGLFKEFRYDAIGLGCVLANGVCTMSGVGPADKGYYIVRGSGLPRIDVIGYNRLVDWNVLLTRLQRVTTSGPARVE